MIYIVEINSKDYIHFVEVTVYFNGRIFYFAFTKNSPYKIKSIEHWLDTFSKPALKNLEKIINDLYN